VGGARGGREGRAGEAGRHWKLLACGETRARPGLDLASTRATHPEEHLLVAVEGVDDQREQLVDFRLCGGGAVEEGR